MDPITLFLIIALVGFVVFQVFQGKKRKRETEDRVSKFVPGVEIMTNYGLYGVIVEVDDEKNLVTLEVSPGVEVKMHKQTMLKVADYNDIPGDDSRDDIDVDDADAADVDELDASSTRVTELDADADVNTTTDAPETASKNTPTTPSFSAASPIVTEAAPAYGERIVPSTEPSSTTAADAGAVSDPAKARTPRRPATPRATPTRSTTPRSTAPRAPRASSRKPVTPQSDDSPTDTSTN